MAFIDRAKSLLISTVIVVCLGWAGMRLYAYFTHHEPPAFAVTGVEEQGTYGSAITATVSAQNAYKVGVVTVELDGKQVHESWVKDTTFTLPVTLDTSTVPDGEHVLTITARDTSYHANTSTQSFQVTIDNTPLTATCLQREYTVYQGKTLHLQIGTNKKFVHGTVTWDGRPYPLTPITQGASTFECFLPIDCEAQPSDLMLSTDVTDLAGHKAKVACHVQIKAFDFPKQRGFTVSEEKISQEREAGLSMQALGEAIAKALPQSPQQKLWKGAFLLPIDAKRFPTPFGEVRTSPINGRYLHKGVDLANYPRSIVWAAQNGIVIIKDRYFTTGNTVVVDHGLGVHTLYAHLDSFADVEVGQSIKKGSPLGKVGMTGYANGYHLHWELRINNVGVDPMEWTAHIF